MSNFSSDGLAVPFPLSAEIQARLRDFLSRKSLHLPKRIEALLATMSGERIRSSLRVMMDLLRRERRSAAEGGDWSLLVERIHDHGRRGTIESYADYLFAVDFKT